MIFPIIVFQNHVCMLSGHEAAVLCPAERSQQTTLFPQEHSSCRCVRFKGQADSKTNATKMQQVNKQHAEHYPRHEGEGSYHSLCPQLATAGSARNTVSAKETKKPPLDSGL